ncbi:hypothetical protein PDESU_02626 [Pontiella desulfatans]|uniref:Polysaccharide lyase family 8 C-terminal domain-containing protein n=1 Tax=Pontiella desulfatans TaxID=2750659 RepID=A0A6C2U2P8_PONDE|nr:polysaccharide lyase beta-sandwich domain-containing protein [Pontiella desulfatans]VGO14069.1 hypothetical protein PDESU_02626 [Pontiella desulfatans]
MCTGRDRSGFVVCYREKDACICCENKYTGCPPARTCATHAIVVPGQKVWALVNFQSLEEPLGPFLSISQPCLVLLKQQDNGDLRVSVSDPRLELTGTTTAPPVDVVLEVKGSYEPAQAVAGVSANPTTGGGTEVVVRCAEGMPSAFTLRAR